MGKEICCSCIAVVGAKDADLLLKNQVQLCAQCVTNYITNVDAAQVKCVPHIFAGRLSQVFLRFW
jgi:hypothetical protein